MPSAPAPPISEAAQIENLIGTARRRSLTVLALEQLALFAAALLCCAILVILFGTGVIPTPAIVLLVLGLLLAWVFRVRQGARTSSAIAQIVDSKLALNDTISTAHFLLHSPDRQEGAWRHYPVQQAAALASTVAPKLVFPFRGQRWWAISGLLLLITAGCFSARYLVTRTLSLRPPLITLALPPILQRIEEALGTKETDSIDSARQKARDKAASNATGEQQKENRAEQAADPVPPPLEARAPASSNGEPGSRNEEGKPEMGDQRAAGASNGDDPAQSASQQASQPGESGASKANQPNANEQSGASAKSEDAASKPSLAGSSSLMSRMKDTLSSMMAKLNPQSAGQKSANAGDPSKPAGQQGQQSAKAGEQSAAQQGSASQENGKSEASSGGQGDGQTAEKPGGAQGQSSSDSQQKGSDSQSGVGQQDGDKQLRDAEQQKAMGKLAEVLGKRSAELTGDMSVETPSGNQQLKTEYSNRLSRHSDSSGEINRNEVPARYREYVREYMEQVHKAKPQK